VKAHEAQNLTSRVLCLARLAAVISPLMLRMADLPGLHDDAIPLISAELPPKGL
jgi:hypothetical protein